jgi:hypothetical protein
MQIILFIRKMNNSDFIQNLLYNKPIYNKYIVSLLKITELVHYINTFDYYVQNYNEQLYLLPDEYIG